MFAHWGTFEQRRYTRTLSCVGSCTLVDEGLHVEDTAADGPQFLLGSGVWAYDLSLSVSSRCLANTRVTVAAFSGRLHCRRRGSQSCETTDCRECLLWPTASPWAVLLCKFNDDASEPFVRTFYENLFTAAGRGTHNMVDYFWTRLIAESTRAARACLAGTLFRKDAATIPGVVPIRPVGTS